MFRNFQVQFCFLYYVCPDDLQEMEHLMKHLQDQLYGFLIGRTNTKNVFKPLPKKQKQAYHFLFGIFWNLRRK